MAALLSLLCCSTSAVAYQPHIVFFLADDYGVYVCSFGVAILLLSCRFIVALRFSKYFVSHATGFADIGYHVDMYGNSSNRISTPNLDKLAYSGIRLENYYIQPVCVRKFGLR